MDIDRGLVSRILQDGQIGKVVDIGFSSDLLDEEVRPLFEYTLQFWRDHGVVPEATTVLSKFQDFQLDEVREPIEFWIEEAQKRFVHNQIQSEIQEAVLALNEGRPFDALDGIRAMGTRVDIGVRRSLDVNMAQNTDVRLERLRHAREMIAKDGKYLAGISSPWEKLDRETLGFQGGQMITVAARTNVGKTWAMCILGGHAWLIEFKRPLFISKEMLNEEIQARFDAFLSKIAARRLRRGTVSDLEFESYKEYLEDMRKGHDLWISSDDEDGGISSIAAKIEQYRPDLVLIDGVYLLRDEERATASWERMQNISRGVKRLAKSKKIPIIISTQFNRNQTSNKTTGYLENLAFADALSNDSDVVLALFQPQEYRDKKEMKLSLIKAREGELIDMTLDWNFDTMSFGEREESKTVEEIENDEETVF